MPDCFGFDFKAGFDYIAEAGPKLKILWSQLPNAGGTADINCPCLLVMFWTGKLLRPKDSPRKGHPWSRP